MSASLPRPAPRLLVVAGDDPSGAGLAADRDALAGLALEARFVASALTQQDERGLVALGAREPAEWLAEALAQADAPAQGARAESAPPGTSPEASPGTSPEASPGTAARESVRALKLGLLPGPAHAAAAGRLIDALEQRRGAPPSVVLDPVLAPSRGGRFLDATGVRALVDELGARGALVTPNLPELAELAAATGAACALEELASSPQARVGAARRLLAAGFAAVVVKGGHGAEEPVLDLVVLPERVLRLEHPRLVGRSIRGSGCRFASRLAAGLALGEGLEEAVRRAGELVLARLVRAT